MFHMARVDFRLIHGQIIAKWKQSCGIDRIVVIDDILATDEFMTRVYASSLPAGVDLSVYTEAEALKRFRRMGPGEENLTMVLFKDVPACYRCIKAGLALGPVQLGGVPWARDRFQIARSVFLNEEDMRCLQELHDIYHVEISVQVIPENAKISYEQLLQIYKHECDSKGK